MAVCSFTTAQSQKANNYRDFVEQIPLPYVSAQDSYMVPVISRSPVYRVLTLGFSGQLLLEREFMSYSFVTLLMCLSLVA